MRGLRHGVAVLALLTLATFATGASFWMSETNTAQDGVVILYARQDLPNGFKKRLGKLLQRAEAGPGTDGARRALTLKMLKALAAFQDGEDIVLTRTLFATALTGEEIAFEQRVLTATRSRCPDGSISRTACTTRRLRTSRSRRNSTASSCPS